jgi:hypothetical protein
MNAVFLRLTTIVILGTTLVYGCECKSPKVRDALKRADVVFRGRIIGFRDSGKGYQVAIFTVDRVWKGDIPRTFEMPALKETSACAGFWPSSLEVGKYLLVYAQRVDGTSDYVTDICSRTALAEESRDFTELGAGRQPNSK